MATAAVAGAMVLGACASGPQGDVATAPEATAAADAAAGPPPPGLHVSGNRLMDGARPVQLRGVNRAGTEYACIQGWGIFDGPNTDASVRAMARWHVNAVRIPLNTDCWLGINGVKPQLGGGQYRRAIVDYVRLLHSHGMYAELSLMWSAPGSRRATYQPAGPDLDHAPAVWRSMAATFKGDRDVVLAPWGETIVDAGCFLHGGCEASFAPGVMYRVAGMQQAVNAMRGAGYRGVIAIPGINFANDLSAWLSHMPRDPRGQLIAEAHAYGGNVCGDASCFDRTYAPVARRVPLLLGEAGESFDGSDCGSARMRQILAWADAHRAGYLAWTWDAWGNCSALIRDYAGTPFSPYGAFVRSHLTALAGR